MPATALELQSPSTTLSPLVWHAPLRDPSGYADEARHFLFALHAAGVPVAAREIRWSEKIAQLAPDRDRTLREMLAREMPLQAVHVLHILANAFRRLPDARVLVGRTMFETDRLPEGWAQACNQMDAVWVPSEFNRETFAFAGVQREKLRVVPGGIDLRAYDPTCEPLRIEGTRGYNFLAVFDWTLRKGWDVMLRAYVETFTPDEDVALIIKTHSSMGYTTQDMGGMIATFLTETLGYDLNQIPDIVLQDTTIPDHAMPSLYRAADCYVAPTRGEGWGRPIMEAMAMGLPVIATHWSGQTAFLTGENSLLLDYEVVDVPEFAWRETPTYRGHRWAEPSLPHLKQLLRRAFESRAEGRELGQCARAHLKTHFTYESIAATLIAEIERLG